MNNEPLFTGVTIESPSDEQLAQRAQLGCAASFEQLVRRFQVPLVHFLGRRTRCQADAEDVAQETLIRAHRSLDRYSPQWRFRTWLFTIAHRLSINSGRRRSREEPAAAGMDSIRSPAPDVAEVLIAEESRRTLWDRAGELLDEEQVAVLWLHYVEELSTAELAQVLGRSRAAVKTLMFRARKKLLPHIAELKVAYAK